MGREEEFISGVKYEYTRSIRFNLKDIGKNSLKVLIDFKNEDREEALKNFLVMYKDLIRSYELALFLEKADSRGEGCLKIKTKVEIKKSWLRQFARETFYLLKVKNQDTYNKDFAENYGKDLLRWFDENKEILAKLDKFVNSSLENKTSRSEISMLIRRIQTKDNVDFVELLSQEGILNDKIGNEKIDDFINKTKNFISSLELVSFLWAPKSGQGVEIKRASFNFYTVNKTVMDFNEKIIKMQQKFDEKYNRDINKYLLEKVNFIKFLENQTKSLESLSVLDFYEQLKLFKSKQKREFYERLSGGLAFKNLETDFPLFLFSENTHSHTTAQQEFEKFKSAIPPKRKIFYDYNLKRYKQYCTLFKQVAMVIGKIKASIKVLEKEKFETRMLKYWANILKKGNKKFLLLIPKDKMREARIEIEKLPPVKDGEAEDSLFSFKSMTLRALEKLIRKNLGKEQQDLADDKKAVELYKNVLEGKFSELQDLDLQTFKIDELLNQNFQTKEDFRIAFEKNAYFVEKRELSEEASQAILGMDGTIFAEITAYDLERELIGNKKEHTVLWEDFWSEENYKNNFLVRLNPEVRIFFRPRDDEQLNENKRHNRFSKEHYGVTFSFLENACTKQISNSFVGKDAVKDKIKNFNKEVIDKFIKKEDQEKNLWYYGIDRGQQELATLCVVGFQNEETIALPSNITDSKKATKKSLKTIPAQIKVYKIKEEFLFNEKEIIKDRRGSKTKVIAYKNPSYFTNENIFEENEVSCIDLTTAKLIGGKIILNGDLSTFMALKRAGGKRKLLESLSHISAEAKIEFDEEKKQFKVKREDENFLELPYWTEKLEKVLPYAKIQEEFQEYLNNLHSSENFMGDDVSIEKINHLKDAITANMIGIIFHLFREFPGIINLENADISKIDYHLKKNNENISRRLEWSLYKKFQKLFLVPPNLKETILLKEEKELDQFGIINFVKIDGTSKTCPYCEKETKDQKKNHNAYGHHYNCSECGFNTESNRRGLTFIDNSDSVAAYNIARRGTILLDRIKEDSEK
jgi:predicted RNA-binding Zn-ribbon protein involved in translation (DUF1610 family)